MINGEAQVGWGELSGDDQDFFMNPHVYINGTRAAFTTDGFSYAERAKAVVDRLTTDGAKEALSVLNAATKKLDQYKRVYPTGEVADVTEALRAKLGEFSEAE